MKRLRRTKARQKSREQSGAGRGLTSGVWYCRGCMGVVHALGSADRPAAELGALSHMRWWGLSSAFYWLTDLFPISDCFTSEKRRNQQNDAVRKVTLLSNLNGYAPPIAVEFGAKRSIPANVRRLLNWKSMCGGEKSATTDDNRGSMKNQAHRLLSSNDAKPKATGQHMDRGDCLCRLYDCDDGLFSGDVAVSISSPKELIQIAEYFRTPLRLRLRAAIAFLIVKAQFPAV